MRDPPAHAPLLVEVRLDGLAELGLSLGHRAVRKEHPQLPFVELGPRAQEGSRPLRVHKPPVGIDEVEGAVAGEPSQPERGLADERQREPLHRRLRDPGEVPDHSTST